MSKQKPKILTGIRPTGEMHLGNYLSAIKPSVERAQEYDTYFCLVDLHAITTPYNPKELPNQIKVAALDWLAGGINPKMNILFIQSHVREHVELMWLLNTITPVGELQRMTQYKDFVKRYGEPQGGILNYPILMAADILLYKAELVPVGEDQQQHLELTRDLAKKFNRIYGDTFPIPENVTKKNHLRIKSLNDPRKKMSKSLGPKSYIALSDDENTIRKKISSAITDTGTQNQKSKAKSQNTGMSPGVKNLFDILNLTNQGDAYSHLLTKYNEGKLNYSELKPVVADSVIDFLKPIQARRVELERNLDEVAKILTKGAEQARVVASTTLKEVKEKMGLF